MSPSPAVSPAHRTAAILNVAVCLFGFLFALPVLQDGAEAAADSGDQPPFAVIVISFVLAVVGLVSSYGVWQGQRWGVILTIVVNALSFLSGVPGVAFGPTTFLVVSSIVGCAVNVLIVYLLLRRSAAPSVEPAVDPAAQPAGASQSETAH